MAAIIHYLLPWDEACIRHGQSAEGAAGQTWEAQGRAGRLPGAEFDSNVMSFTHHLNCFRKMLRFRLFLESRKVT